jgi:hypothetical protein
MMAPKLNYFSTLSPCKLRYLSYLWGQLLKAFFLEGHPQAFQPVLHNVLSRLVTRQGAADLKLLAVETQVIISW